MDLKLTHDGVPVTISHEPYVEDGAPTFEALAFLTSLIGCFDEFRRYAARKKLLRLYNESWLDENHRALDENGFVTKLTNPRVLLDEAGAATVYFDDGGMLGGHWVEVIVHKGELFGADIIG